MMAPSRSFTSRRRTAIISPSHVHVFLMLGFVLAPCCISGFGVLPAVPDLAPPVVSNAPIENARQSAAVTRVRDVASTARASPAAPSSFGVHAAGWLDRSSVGGNDGDGSGIANSAAMSSTLSTASATSAATATTPADTVGKALSDLYGSYKNELRAEPLKTKMMTGAVIATLGDFVAQAAAAARGEISGKDDEKEDDDSVLDADEVTGWYDAKRAVSFAAFDSVYRAVQHVLYPPIIQHLHGQYFLTVFVALGFQDFAVSTWEYWGPVEQSLCAQLAIIPTIYYPVFYAVTGVVQGLTFEETKARARETFIPLMKRNLLFWIPVQFVVFGWVEQNVQIPVLSLCGLVWTLILSVAAGNARGGISTPTHEEAVEAAFDAATAGAPAVAAGHEEEYFVSVDDEPYCVTGMEPGCFIDPDDVFHPPHHLEQICVNGDGDDEECDVESVGVAEGIRVRMEGAGGEDAVKVGEKSEEKTVVQQ